MGLQKAYEGLVGCQPALLNVFSVSANMSIVFCQSSIFSKEGTKMTIFSEARRNERGF